MIPLWGHLLVIAIVLQVVLPSDELTEADCRLVAGWERDVLITVHMDFVGFNVFINTTHRVGPI